MRSRSCQLQRLAPVPHRRIQRRMRVPDGLGQTGGAGTEHQHRVAVRRREHGVGSAGAIGSSRCNIGIRPASTGWSPTAWLGSVSASACSTSSRFHAGLISTAAAPSRQIASRAATNSGRLDAITATRSPAPTPLLRQGRSQPVGQRIELRQAESAVPRTRARPARSRPVLSGRPELTRHRQS